MGKVLVQFLFKHRVKNCLGWLKFWSKTRIFFKNNLRLMFLNRFVRFLCASLNFVPITGFRKSLRISGYIKSHSDYLYLILKKKLDRFPGYNSGDLSGLFQLMVFIHCWFWPWPTSTGTRLLNLNVYIKFLSQSVSIFSYFGNVFDHC